jgi:hypothetical protein
MKTREQLKNESVHGRRDEGRRDRRNATGRWEIISLA